MTGLLGRKIPGSCTVARSNWQKPIIGTVELRCCCSQRGQKNWEKKDICYNTDRPGQNPGKSDTCLRVTGKLLSGQQVSPQSPATTPLSWAGGTEGLCSKTGVIHLNVIPPGSTWALNVSLDLPGLITSQKDYVDDGLRLHLSKWRLFLMLPHSEQNCTAGTF